MAQDGILAKDDAQHHDMEKYREMIRFDHEGVPTSVLEQIALNPQEQLGVRERALNHKSLPPDLAGKIAAQIAANPKDTENMRKRALDHQHLPGEVAGKILSQIAANPQEHQRVRKRALDHKRMSPEEAAKIAAQIAANPKEDYLIREEMLNHHSLSPDVAGKIAAQIAANPEEHWVIRKAALGHKDISPEIAGKISEQIAANHKEDAILRERALDNKNLSSDFLRKFTQTETNSSLLEKAKNHPNHPKQQQAKALREAHRMWRSYEKQVDPSHFAAVKAAITGQKQTVSHRGKEGASDQWEETIPHLKTYAAAVQKKVAESAHFLDENAPDPVPDHLGEETGTSSYAKDDKPYIKNIKGIPHVFVMRGVAGDYASQISHSLGIAQGNGSSAHPNAANNHDREAAMQVFHSWTTSPKVAHQFANRKNAPGGRGTGLVIKQWLPLNNLLHSGHHDVFTGQDHVHEYEKELVFAHPEEKMHINHDNIMSVQDSSSNQFHKYTPPKVPSPSPATGMKAPEVKEPKATAPSMKAPKLETPHVDTGLAKSYETLDQTAIPEDEVSRLLKHPDPVERSLALKLFNVCPAHILGALQHHTDPAFRANLLNHHKCDSAALHHVLHSPTCVEDLHNAACSPSFNDEHMDALASLAADPFHECSVPKSDYLDAVCKIVCAKQTLTNPSVIAKLVVPVYKKNTIDAYDLLRHASSNGSVFDTFFDHVFDNPTALEMLPDELAQMIADPRLCPDVVGRAFALHRDNKVRTFALASPHAPRQHVDDALACLFSDPNHEFGCHVAKNPALTDGDIHRLLACNNQQVQDLAMIHPSVGESHTKKIESLKLARNPAQEVRKNESNLENGHKDACLEIAYHMQGFRPHLDKAFEAARFLVGAAPASMPAIRRALWKADGDIEAAALFAYNLEDTERNREALRAVQELKDCEKSEQQPLSGSVVAVHADSEAQAQAVQRAYDSGQAIPVRLNGKHSEGALIAQDPNSHMAYLLKPGSGKQSPALGSREDPSSQAQREAAFWAVANKWGLGKDIPRCDLLIIDHKQVACIELLQEGFKSVQVWRKNHSSELVNAMVKYLADGSIHKWAVMDYVLGNPDRHADNMMISQEGRVILIDHGSAFCGFGFDPAFDQNSFVPYYLRYTAPADFNFNTASTEDRLKYMQSAPSDQHDMLNDWVGTLKPDTLEEMLKLYGVDPAACVERLQRLQQLIQQGEAVDRAINMLWTGA